jgi:hypothetical protein
MQWLENRPLHPVLARQPQSLLKNKLDIFLSFFYPEGEPEKEAEV